MTANRFLKEISVTYSNKFATLSNIFINRVSCIEISNPATFSTRKRATPKSGKYLTLGGQ